MSTLFRLSPRRSVLCLLGAGAVLLAGCGGGERKSDTQIAATVNKGEISVHQVQTVLQRQPRLTAADAGGTATARVLEGLIDQELAAQAARNASLEKDPRVVQSLEAARRELLALAWQESIAAKASNPSSDEIDRYYEAHPELFAQRRLYILQETSLEGTPEQLGGLPAKVAQAQSADDVAALLQQAGVRSSARAIAMAAEDLPQKLLEPLSRLEPGRSGYFAQGSTVRIYTVLEAHKAPVERRLALNAIGAYLAKDRRNEAVSQAMKELRGKAKIEYLGGFAKGGENAASAAPAR
ncbi:EpsD family peptidyl-prolyl cis-trans isomerase [Piscinibacter sp.]|jgi:EpsD family peptidyl-prolyl cis-trans isomerase|uniref:EpsD family peptidyl-prolyl cis-trans isomerase n=1 Tax=Piscinibacter sp. TaxID=1903157 RepID=UPI0025D7B667|nr:EpsD family peptidyl-prolyl cis-trans isomerase [Piscinibacter sp.]HNW64431.1 EpsD family peptidyl-prolyl cis-trans isomerase [Piscinibacter sp.]HOY34231.1 EpsD family peptidyl-prolyl cis-trans isomerase [Piscinibacter sp.]